MIHVVIINGQGGVGKSEFCKQSQKYCQERWKQVIAYETSTVDFVKRVAKYAGWDGNKDEKGRKLLYDIKEALTKYDGIPNKSVIKHIEEIEQMNKVATHIVFVNCRQSYDIASLKELIANTHEDWNIITLLIKNSKMTSNEVPALIEEINKTKYDCTIDNTGDIDLLYKLAGNFLEDIIDGKYNKEKPDYEKMYNDLLKAYKAAFENFMPDFSPIEANKDNTYTNYKELFADDSFPDVCKGCTNNPVNGGSGICCCSLPYMTTTGKPLEVTYNAVTDINSFKDNARLNTVNSIPNHFDININSETPTADVIGKIANSIFTTVTDAMTKRMNNKL